jgi:3-oxoacyl-[acyl-carrier protein] reductase
VDLGLDGKVAVVAAASKGLGKAVALGLAREGCRVVMFSSNEANIRAAGDEVRERSGAQVEALAADVTREEDIRRVVERATASFGQVDILFNNSGGPRPGMFDDLGDDDWRKATDLLLLNAVRFTRLVLPGMKQRRWGRIIKSTSVSVKQPIPNLLLSNALRSAVTAMANSLAREVAPYGITVNNLAPGRILTERVEQLDQDTARRQNKPVEEVRAASIAQIPAARYGTPEEFAAAAVFLASAPAAYITGVTLLVDGGVFRGTY